MSPEEGRPQPAKPVHTLRPQNQQFQPDGQRQRRYSALRPEHDAHHHSNGKKFYCRPDGQKQRRCQAELKAGAGGQGGRPANGYRPPPGLQQPWVGGEHAAGLSKAKDVTMEMHKLPAGLGGHGEAQKVREPPRQEGAHGRKLKIVKNKNKNGRIVIVMSKYLENGSQAAKGPGRGGRSGAGLHLEETRLVAELGAAKHPPEHDPAPSAPSNGGKARLPRKEPSATRQQDGAKVRGQERLPADQPVPTDSGGGQGDLLAPKRRLLDAAHQEPGSSHRSAGSAHTRGGGDGEQEEPMDLRVLKPPEAHAAPPPPGSPAQPGRQEAFPSFQPLLGNVVITDITTNCLTVTFREFVAA